MKAYLFGLLLPLAAHAEIYKCTGPDGKLNLTDRPCGQGESAEVVNIPPPPESPYEREMREARESMARSDARIAELEERARQRRIAQASRYWGRTLREGLSLGMTSDEVLALDAWGFPDDKNSTESKRLVREQWIYRTDIDNEHERMYLYFHNGRLVTIQD